MPINIHKISEIKTKPVHNPVLMKECSAIQPATVQCHGVPESTIRQSHAGPYVSKQVQQNIFLLSGFT